MNLKYFKLSEFDCPTHEGSGINMDATILRMLDELRERYGKPIRITSGYRTAEYNKELADRGYKASPNSSHLRGLAVDIACSGSSERHDLLRLAFEVGFDRIGIANTFLHLDIDGSKPANCIWTY